MATIDYLRCPDGKMHSWVYGGRKSGLYRCAICPAEYTKAVLKEKTDA